MEINLKIQSTVQRVFEPQKLRIIIGVREGDFVHVETELLQNTPTGWVRQYAKHLLPDSILAAFTGFDIETLQPTIDESAANQILASFGLEIDT